MEVGKLEAVPRNKKEVDKPTGILLNGENNDYPNKIKMIAQGSGTAMNCLKTYQRFLMGGGFVDPEIGKVLVNPKKRLTLNNILRAVIFDYALQRGVTLHQNFNANLKVCDVTPVDFETARLGEPDDTGYICEVALNPCWQKLEKKSIKRVFINNYNPEIVKAQIAKVKGIDNYRGQIYYWSNVGLDYPLSIIDSVATDCVAEEGCANVKKRNVKNNFMPAGVLVTYGKTQGKNIDSTNEVNLTEAERVALRMASLEDKASGNSIEDTLIQFQGDQEACKIMSIKIDFVEEKPEFIPFPIHNFDKEFEYTETSAQRNIGKAFNQPPVLRSDLTPGQLGTSQEIIDAYNYYNNVTAPDRSEISEILKEVFSNFDPAIYDFRNIDFSLQPLKYLT